MFARRGIYGLLKIISYVLYFMLQLYAKKCENADTKCFQLRQKYVNVFVCTQKQMQSGKNVLK